MEPGTLPPSETGQLLSPGLSEGVGEGAGAGRALEVQPKPHCAQGREGLWISEAEGPGRFRGQSPGRRPQDGPAAGYLEDVGCPDGEPEARAAPTALTSRFCPVTSCQFPFLEAD